MFKNNEHRKEPVIINNKFSFVQIPKTASTTIMFNAKHENLVLFNKNLWKHAPLENMEMFIKNTDNPVYYVVRNPFIQIYSWFWHCIRYKTFNLTHKHMNIKGFEHYVKNILLKDKHMKCFSHFINNTKDLPLTCFKFENGVDTIIQKINEAHNLDFRDVDTNVNHLSEYKKDKETIMKYYENKEIRDIVINYRKEDFEKYDYSIDIRDI